MTVVVFTTVPHLPPGMCFGDSGELQLVAVTLGITHAPGYPIFASLGHLCTLIPDVDPTFMVSLACFGAGLAALWLCFLLQIRLGICTGVAGALTLAMAAHERTWVNLVAPEVYAPTLVLQAGASYLLIKHARLGQKADLYMAALLFGTALANRPPLVLSVPFVLVVWWIARRVRGAHSWKTHLRSLGLCTVCAAIPGVYALGYLYVRDSESTIYDYIEMHDREYNMVPNLDEGVAAKVERVLWHTSAREFGYAMGNDAKGVWNKLRWLRMEFFLYQPAAFCLTVGLILAGVLGALRRERPAAILLLGMIVSNLIFLCAYRMWGQAADYLALLWAVIVLLGFSTTIVSCGRWSRVVRQFGLVAWAVMGALTISGTFNRPRAALAGDATPFLRQMDFATLPDHAVVCVAWPETPVVLYARYVQTRRDDIDVLPAAVINWERMLEPYKGRPIFGASHSTQLARFEPVPFRNIWRLGPRVPPVQE